MESSNPQTDPGQQPAGGQGTGEQPAAAETGTGPIDPEGQRAWLATLDRRLSTRTWIGAAAAVIALAAGIVAIVLALDASNNSASKGDLNRIERELGVVAEDASGATEAQESIDALSGRVDSLEDQISGATSADDDAQQRLKVLEDDIEDLRQQLSDLDSSGGAGSGN